jgi:hypothetical protein
LIRVGGQRKPGPVGQGGHHGKVMGDNVVHLRGDSCPFGSGCDHRLLVAVSFEAFGAVV